MFQTEPILYLQSLGNEWLTIFMILVTTLGSSAFLVALILATTFGIDFKKGFLLFQLLIWTGLITGAFKILVAFPRPDFVDNRVLNLEYGTKNISPFRGNWPEGVFRLPNNEILKAFRLQDSVISSPFGFPSGHVAITTSLWGGAAVLFNNRLIKFMIPFMIISMAFSRMYLGRHFLGDVIGGAILGLILLGIFIRFIKSPLKEAFFEKENFEFSLRPKNLFFYIFMFILPVFLTGLNLVGSDTAGFLLGTNIAYLLIIRKGIPVETENSMHNLIRVFIALGLFGISTLILKYIFEPAGVINYLQFNLLEFFKTFIPSFTIWISVVICRKFGLYTEIEK